MGKKLELNALEVTSFTTATSGKVRGGAGSTGGLCVSALMCSDAIGCSDICTGLGCDSDYCQSGVPHVCLVV